MHPGEQSITGFDPMWQTERREVPRLLTLHLLCVCYFNSTIHINCTFLRNKIKNHEKTTDAMVTMVAASCLALSIFSLSLSLSPEDIIMWHLQTVMITPVVSHCHHFLFLLIETQELFGMMRDSHLLHNSIHPLLLPQHPQQLLQQRQLFHQ